MTRRRFLAWQIATVAASLILAGAAVAAGLVAIVGLGFACYGSDVSDGPPPGSFAAELCALKLPYVWGFALVGAAGLGPIVGGIWSARVGRWRPFAYGCAVAVCSLALLVASFDFL